MKALNLVVTSFIFIVLIASFSCAENYDQGKSATTSENLEGLEKATVAGGCFWCVEAVFERVEGVEAAISGYTGGKEANPNYTQVSSGKTTHAEAVEIYFDPSKINYRKILEIFFATHDPTTLNRQGPDVGAQYRSEIYYHTDEQKRIIREVIDSLSSAGVFKNKIVTKISPYTQFYKAEEYHQDYYEHNPGNPYVASVTRPKIEKFEKEYKKLLKQEYQKN